MMIPTLQQPHIDTLSNWGRLGGGTQLATERGTTNRVLLSMYQREFRSEIAGGTC